MKKDWLAIFTVVQIIEITPSMLLTALSSTEIKHRTKFLHLWCCYQDWSFLTIHFLKFILQPKNVIFQPATFMNLSMWFKLLQKGHKYTVVKPYLLFSSPHSWKKASVQVFCFPHISTFIISSFTAYWNKVASLVGGLWALTGIRNSSELFCSCIEAKKMQQKGYETQNIKMGFISFPYRQKQGKYVTWTLFA